MCVSFVTSTRTKLTVSSWWRPTHRIALLTEGNPLKLSPMSRKFLQTLDAYIPPGIRKGMTTANDHTSTETHSPKWPCSLRALAARFHDTRAEQPLLGVITAAPPKSQILAIFRLDTGATNRTFLGFKSKCAIPSLWTKACVKGLENRASGQLSQSFKKKKKKTWDCYRNFDELKMWGIEHPVICSFIVGTVYDN